MKVLNLEDETNTKFVDAAFLLDTDKGGQEVVVEFPACGEDEELLLATHGEVAAETVDVGNLVDVEAGGYSEVETTLVVFGDVADLEGKHHGVEGVGNLFAVEVIDGELLNLVRGELVAVGIGGVAVAESDVEVPTACNGHMVVEHKTEAVAHAVVQAVVAQQTTVEEERGRGVGCEARTASPGCIMLLLFALFLGFLLINVVAMFSILLYHI